VRLSLAGARSVYSQFGEDGILARVFDLIGEGERWCVEFGAMHAFECSNTARLRAAGWRATLFEDDCARFERLVRDTAGEPATECRLVHVEPTGPRGLRALLGGDPDLLSIDVDGPDYFYVRDLELRPRVLVLEYNTTMPPWVDIRPAEMPTRLGASPLAMSRAAKAKGYDLVAVTECNLICVHESESPGVTDEWDDLDRILTFRQFPVIVTDFDGHPLQTTAESLYFGFSGFAHPSTEAWSGHG
jgi:hypothetical protein